MNNNRLGLLGGVGRLLIGLACLVVAVGAYFALRSVSAPVSVYVPPTSRPTAPVALTSQVEVVPVLPAGQSHTAPVSDAACPTEREFQQLTGVTADIVRKERCAFHWRGDPQTISAIHPCPFGWSCTLGVEAPRQTFVYVGDDNLQSLQIFAGTWYLIGKYPVGDAVYTDCGFLEKVRAEGRISDPTWTAFPGNFTCQ